MKVLVVHQGRRDNYEVANALVEAGHDVTLVTSGYSTGLIRKIASLFSLKGLGKLAGRKAELIPDSKVSSSNFFEIFFRIAGVAFGENFSQQAIDYEMYLRSVRLHKSEPFDCLVCYNYNAFRLFSDVDVAFVPKILFQCHPHPLIIRERFFSLIKSGAIPAENKEKEFSYSAGYQAMLMAEPMLAHHVISASSFTKKSLLMAGVAEDRISVVPYGVGNAFRKQSGCQKTRHGSRLRLIFVGQFVYRKGLAVIPSILNKLSIDVDVVFVGRGLNEVDPLSGLDNDHVHASVFWDVSFDKLVELYQGADVFVFPSVIEGFAHVILEAMQAGCVPVVSDATCGPDVVREGVDGFVIEPGDVDAYVRAIESLRDFEKLDLMSRSAIERASNYSWGAFRNGVVDAVDYGYEKAIKDFAIC